MKKIKILVQPRFTYSDGLLSFFPIVKDKIVQGESFCLNFRVTNVSDSFIDKIVLKNIKISSAENHKGIHFFKKEYLVKDLNPGESKLIKISDFGTYLRGLAFLQMDLVSSDGTDVTTFQNNSFKSGEEIECINEFSDFFFITSISEHEQEKSNYWLLFLTVLIVLTTVVIPFTNFIQGQKYKSGLVNFCKDNPDKEVYTTMDKNEFKKCSQILKQYD